MKTKKIIKKCDLCGKTPKVGRNVSHSQRKTPREFKVNLQKVKLNLYGTPEHFLVCGKCIKKLKSA